jgi:hypothetical protein
MVDTRVGLDFATGKAEENKEDGLPDQEMQSASRTGHRNAAMQASQRGQKRSTGRSRASSGSSPSLIFGNLQASRFLVNNFSSTSVAMIC